MTHISFIDALVLTLQVCWKIALNFWPLTIGFIAMVVHEELTNWAAKRKK